MLGKTAAVNVYTDGGARGNPGPAGIGILVTDIEGNEILRHNDYIGESTNNVAEYCALIAGLEIASSLDIKEVNCYLDSELVVRQLNGIYRVKNKDLKKLYSEVKRKEKEYRKVSYTHLPREEEHIRIADLLVNKALDSRR